METNQFINKVFNDINALRTNPSSFNPAFKKAVEAIKLWKGQESFIKDIEEYIAVLQTMKGVSPLRFNAGLCSVAEEQIEIFRTTGSVNKKIDAKLLKQRADNKVMGCSQIQQLVDDGSETADNVIFRLCFNKADKSKLNRQHLFSTTFKEIGIGHLVLNDENVVVFVLADKAEMIPNKPVIAEVQKLKSGRQIKTGKKPEDDSYISKAFNNFDVFEEGNFDPQTTLNALKVLDIDHRNPTLFRILNELDTDSNRESGVDFDKFEKHVNSRLEDTKTEDGLRIIFDLLIDDPTNNTITLATLKRLCADVGKSTPAEQLNEMLANASENGNEITFDEFREYMTRNQ